MRFVVGIDETHKKNQEPVRSNRNIRIYRGITSFLYMIVEEDALYINVNRRFVVGIDETHKKNQEPVRSNIAIRIYRGITTFLYMAVYQTC